MNVRHTLALLLLPLAGCADILGIEETTVATEEPPEAGRDFRCVGTGDAEEPTGEEITIFADVRDLADTSPVGGMRASLCLRRTASSCAADIAVSDGATGLLEVPTDSGFDGHIRLLGPDEDGVERVPYLWYFSRPLYSTRTEPFPMNVTTVDTLTGLLYGGFTPDDTSDDRAREADRGEIAIASADCTDTNAPGVRFLLADSSLGLTDEETGYWVVTGFNEGFPIFEYPEDPTAAVTEPVLALGGWVNVKPGSPTVIMVDGETGEELARTTLLVEPGALTTVRLLPSL